MINLDGGYQSSHPHSSIIYIYIYKHKHEHISCHSPNSPSECHAITHLPYSTIRQSNQLNHNSFIILLLANLVAAYGPSCRPNSPALDPLQHSLLACCSFQDISPRPCLSRSAVPCSAVPYCAVQRSVVQRDWLRQYFVAKAHPNNEGSLLPLRSRRLPVPPCASYLKSKRLQNNMVDSSCPSPEDITLQEFHDALARYDQFIAALSASKGG